jgi:hypothetical protein
LDQRLKNYCRDIIPVEMIRALAGLRSGLPKTI